MAAPDPRNDPLVALVGRWQERVRRHWAHALMAAALLASLTVLVEDPALKWLDVAMLRIVPEMENAPVLGALLFTLGSFCRTDPEKTLKVLVLTIERTYFDSPKAFARGSPIRRDVFLALLNKVTEVFFDKAPKDSAPKVLAIDYDLSRNTKAGAEGLKGQEELDAFLERFAGDPAKRRVLLIH